MLATAVLHFRKLLDRRSCSNAGISRESQPSKALLVCGTCLAEHIPAMRLARHGRFMTSHEINIARRGMSAGYYALPTANWEAGMATLPRQERAVDISPSM